MKYVFFVKGGFQRSDTVWYVGKGENEPLFRRTKKFGIGPTLIFSFNECMGFVRCGFWEMRKYK